MVIARLGLALVLATLLGACNTGDCEQLESCDIRERSCQDSVAKVVACLRDSRAVTPRVQVVDADEFIDEQASQADQEPFDDDTRDHYRALSLFRLMPAKAEPGQLARDEWDDVAAFFDSETRRVTVLDTGTPLDDPGSVIVLAHELVHAQQSRETDDEFYLPADGSRDAYWAASAIVEGEATLYQDLADVYAYGFEPRELDWDRVFLNFESRVWLTASRERAIYERGESFFAYPFGGAYLSEAYFEGGNSAVRKVTRAVPASTLAVSEGYRPKPKSPEVESLEDVAIPMLPESFALLGSERAGAYLFESFLVRAEEDVGFLPELRDTGVVGDSLSTFRVAPDQVSVFWRVRFETEDKATAVERRIPKERGWVLKRDDRDLIVAAVSDDALKGQIDGDLAWGPAPEPMVDTTEDEPPPAKRIRCRLRRVTRGL